MPKKKILSLFYDALSLPEARDAVLRAARERRFFAVFTPCATVAAAAERDGALLSLLLSGDLLLADGVGVSLASRLAGEGRLRTVRGIELGEALFPFAEREGLRVFFYGGKEGVARRAAENIKGRYPSLVIGCASGYGEEPTEKIRAFSPNILFVCLGVGRQEAFIAKNARRLPFACLGLGGSLDVWSGEVRRAPRVLRTVGLEWLWRTALRPSRIKRLLPLPAYFCKCVGAHAKKLLRKCQKEG